MRSLLNFPITVPFKIVFMIICMAFGVLSEKDLCAQDVPIPAYQLKYWCDPYEYTLGGIEIKQPSKKLKKFLKDYYQPVSEEIPDVAFFPQWGYDSIRCIPKTFKISPFYIHNSEISNEEYRAFVADSSNEFFTRGKINTQWVYPDTNVWLSENVNLLPFVSYYFQHPAYNKYPVVGVSQYQATQYCNWLEQKLNTEYKADLPNGYKFIVDLPTQAEFVKAVHEVVNNILDVKPKGIGNDWVKFWVRANLNTINMGPIKTLRLADLYLKNVQFFITQSADCKGEFPCQLLGNVSEWTSTKAKGKLFNHLEYVFTMSERLIPNPDITVSDSELAPYLHKETDLNTHFMVKGGSWNDEFHYVDPSAIMFRRGDYKANNLGFRTVIRVIPE